MQVELAKVKRSTETPPSDIYIGNYAPTTPGQEIADQLILTAGRIIDKLVVCDIKGRPKTKNDKSYSNLQEVHMRRISRKGKSPADGASMRLEDEVRLNFTRPGNAAPFGFVTIDSVRDQHEPTDRRSVALEVAFCAVTRCARPDALFSFTGEDSTTKLWTPALDKPLVLSAEGESVWDYEQIDHHLPGTMDAIVDTLRMAETASETRQSELSDLKTPNASLMLGAIRQASRRDPYDMTPKGFIERYFTIPGGE